ncbi:MAG: hypothetical protein ACLGPM_03745 [Acidobacteriota bacterium]
MSDDRDLDRLIDAALETYADPALGTQLAPRILARVAQEPSHRRLRLRCILWAAIAVPAAICVLLFIGFGPWGAKARRAPVLENAEIGKPGSMTARSGQLTLQKAEAASPIDRHSRHPRLTAAANRQRRLPKLDVFPTPTPPTPQERALADYVAHAPPAAQQALAESEQGQSPMSLASIHALSIDAFTEGANTN